MGIAHQFAGEFEAHLTIRAPAEESRLVDWAARHDLRYSRIMLDRGVTPDQPMLTFARSGTLDDMARAVRTHARALGSAGLDVVRVKIEATPGSAVISAAGSTGSPTP